jgi:hypothetical protein
LLRTGHRLCGNRHCHFLEKEITKKPVIFFREAVERTMCLKAAQREGEGDKQMDRTLLPPSDLFPSFPFTKPKQEPVNLALGKDGAGKDQERWKGRKCVIGPWAALDYIFCYFLDS